MCGRTACTVLRAGAGNGHFGAPRQRPTQPHPAEARITKELPTARSGAQDDYDRARSYAKSFELAIPADPEENPSRTERDGYEVEAQAFVEKHWAKIVTLANEILAKRTVRTRTMAGGEVYELLSK